MRRLQSEQGHSLAGAGALALREPTDSRQQRLASVLVVVAGLLTACDAGGRGHEESKDSSAGARPMTADSPEFAAINQVLAAHVDGLMATPGVVGVAIGLLDDERTPCLRILVTKRTPELESSLPGTLAGHPVLIDEVGVIRPLDEQ